MQRWRVKPATRQCRVQHNVAVKRVTVDRYWDDGGRGWIYHSRGSVERRSDLETSGRGREEEPRLLGSNLLRSVRVWRI